MNCLTKLFQQKRRRIGYILAFSGPMISKRDSSDNSYNLFLLINEKNITNGELKITKNIFSFKNKIEFGHYGELPIFYMVPKNGQIYICDYRNNITKIHSEDIYLYYTKNDVKTKLSDKIIYITWDVIPVIYDAEKKTILNVQRLL